MPDLIGRARRSVAAIVLFAGIGLAVEAQDRGVRLTAPVGPKGEQQVLYTSSHALLVGVSQYDAGTGWQPLESIPRELDEIGAVLKETGFTVEKLLNVSSDELSRAVQGFHSRYGFDRGARLLFFFSGHGYTLDNGDRGFFVPRDVPHPTINERDFRSRALPMQQVATWAGNLLAKHVLYVFDSCFSGSIFRTRSTPIPAPIAMRTAEPVRQFMSSGSAFEEVPAISRFVPAFVRGLRGEADRDNDRYITATELHYYVQGQMYEYRERQTPQIGKLNDRQFDRGEVVFEVPATSSGATRGGPPPSTVRSPSPPPGPTAPITLPFDSGTLTIGGRRVEYRERPPQGGQPAVVFAAPCEQLSRVVTESDPRLMLVIETGGETYRLSGEASVRRAVNLILEMCRRQ